MFFGTIKKVIQQTIIEIMMGEAFQKQIELAVIAAMKEGTQLIDKIIDDEDCDEKHT